MTDVSDPATGWPRFLTKPCATCITKPVGERIALDNKRRGFYDHHSTNPLRIMGRLGGFVNTPPPKDHPR